MRFWIPTSTKSSVFSPSMALSVAAHAALLGSAVYSTGVRSRTVLERQAASVYYLPPPDRRPSVAASEEHVQYVEVGIGASGALALDGAIAGRPAPDETPRQGGGGGADTHSSDMTAPVATDDSVYSILEVDESAARTAGSAAPVYPPELIKAGIEGRVVMRYIIDTSGHADSLSVEVMHATHPAFVQAVREVIPTMRFSPATVQGHPVRQYVEQSFEFRLAPTPPPTPAEHTRVIPVS
jgi:protein TonB